MDTPPFPPLSEADRPLIESFMARKATATPCNACGGRGIIEHFLPEFIGPISTEVCIACWGHRVELTPAEANRFRELALNARRRVTFTIRQMTVGGNSEGLESCGWIDDVLDADVIE